MTDSDSQLLASLFSGLGFELREHLTTITGFSELLAEPEREISPEKRIEYAKAISQAATSIFSTTEQITELARARP